MTLSDGRPGLLICTGWHLTVYDYKNIGSEGTCQGFQHIQIRLAPACFPIGYGLPGDVNLLGQLFLGHPLFLSQFYNILSNCIFHSGTSGNHFIIVFVLNSYYLLLVPVSRNNLLHPYNIRLFHARLNFILNAPRMTASVPRSRPVSSPALPGLGSAH